MHACLKLVCLHTTGEQDFNLVQAWTPFCMFSYGRGLQGQTALMRAASSWASSRFPKSDVSGQLAVLDRLLYLGADIHARDKAVNVLLTCMALRQICAADEMQ